MKNTNHQDDTSKNANKKPDNWQQSFPHKKTPPRVAPRLGSQQKNKGIKNVRKGAR
jgi:hypothetical protein